MVTLSPVCRALVKSRVIEENDSLKKIILMRVSPDAYSKNGPSSPALSSLT